MKQHDAVIAVMEQNGGYATLGHLYQRVPQIPDCIWSTNTPFASIRRIVQDERFFFKIRPGLWDSEELRYFRSTEFFSGDKFVYLSRLLSRAFKPLKCANLR